MQSKHSTDYLNQQLIQSDNLSEFFSITQEVLSAPTFSDYLYQLLEENALKYAPLLVEAQISESYGYQILSGRRMPSRDKVLQLILGAHFNLAQGNRLLKLSGRSELYIKEKRDAILMFAINKKMTLSDTESLLKEQGLPYLVQ